MSFSSVLRPLAEVQEEWKRDRLYCVAPLGVRVSLHLLVKGALMAGNMDEAKPYLERMEALLELVWPTSTPIRMETVRHKDYKILIPCRTADLSL